MAYVSAALKADLAPQIRAICKQYGIRATVAVRNHSTLVLNISQGPVDFLGSYNAQVLERDPTGSRGLRQAVGYLDVNPYYYRDQFTGPALEFLEQVLAVMNTGNWDRSEIQSDYFDVGWYVDVNIGRWDRPYALIK